MEASTRVTSTEAPVNDSTETSTEASVKASTNVSFTEASAEALVEVHCPYKSFQGSFHEIFP